MPAKKTRTRRSKQRGSPMWVPSDGTRNPVCNVRDHAWMNLAEEFERHSFPADTVPANKCQAAVRVIRRLLDCQEPEPQTIAIMRGLVTELSGLLGYAAHVDPAYKGKNEGFFTWLDSVNIRFEDICRLASAADEKKSNWSCSGTSEFGLGFTPFAALLEIEGLAARLKHLLTNDVAPVFAAFPWPPGKNPIDDFLSKAVQDFQTAARACRDAASSCDPQDVCKGLDDLHSAAAELAADYDYAACQLEQICNITQAVSWAVMKDELDKVGFFTAETLRAVNQLRPACSGMSSQLKAVWERMRAYRNEQVRAVYAKFAERQPCPAEHCYEKATERLRIAIDQGLAHAETIVTDAQGCDNTGIREHRCYVDKLVQEIATLDCNRPTGFDGCVLMRMGSFATQAYVILDRSRRLAIDQARVFATGWSDFSDWLKKPTGEPSWQALPFLQAGLSILQLLQNQAQGWGVRTAAPSCNLGLRATEVKIIGDDGEPLSGMQVQIGGALVVSDTGGIIRAMLPPGEHQVKPIGYEFAYPIFVQ